MRIWSLDVVEVDVGTAGECADAQASASARYHSACGLCFVPCLLDCASASSRSCSAAAASASRPATCSTAAASVFRGEVPARLQPAGLDARLFGRFGAEHIVRLRGVPVRLLRLLLSAGRVFRQACCFGFGAGRRSLGFETFLFGCGLCFVPCLLGLRLDAAHECTASRRFLFQLRPLLRVAPVSSAAASALRRSARCGLCFEARLLGLGFDALGFGSASRRSSSAAASALEFQGVFSSCSASTSARRFRFEAFLSASSFGFGAGVFGGCSSTSARARFRLEAFSRSAAASVSTRDC